MTHNKNYFFKFVAACSSGLLLLLTISSWAQSHDLKFSVEHSYLQIPEGIYLKEIYDIAVNTQGELFVLSRGPHPISKFASDGSYLESFGEGLFSQVHSITMDHKDKMWITDVGLHSVFKLDESGRVEMVLGRQNNDGEFYSDAVPLFNKPADVIISERGDIFIADGYGNSRVVKFNQSGNYIKTWGVKGNGNSEFNLPHSLAIDKKQRLLVADRENSRIQLFDLDGNYLETWNLPDKPYCLAIDRNDFIYITLGKAPKILKLDPGGNVLGLFGSEGKGPGQFVMPHGIETGPNNEVYVAEPFNWRVEKFILE
jgi:DNA-binding beta-propeller fold protein YncE